MMIYSFALLITSVSVKAKSVTKIDIVKPIPPKIPAPKIDGQVNPSVSFAHFNFTAKNENKYIPKGLPIASPKTIPVA